MASSTPLGPFETDIGGDLIGWRIERTLINGSVSVDTTVATAIAVGPYFMYLYVDDEAEAVSVAGSGSDTRQNMWYRAGTLFNPVAAAPTENGGTRSDLFEADIKARRIFRRPDEALFLTLENSQAATQSLRFSLSISVLLSHAR